MHTFLRAQPIRASFALRARAASLRPLSTTPLLRTSAGYGDPQDEKIANQTPQPNAAPQDQSLPSSSADPHPNGQGKGTGTSSGVTDPEVGQKTGNAKGQQGSGDKEVTEKEIKETKKVGKKPEKKEVGGAGVIGG